MIKDDNEKMGTFKGEPASEDGWPEVWNTDIPEDDGMDPQEAFDILFGYREEQLRGLPLTSTLTPSNSSVIL